MPTDYHVSCRDAVKTVLAAALLADYPALSANTISMDDPEEDVRTVNLPCVACACVGPEQDRAEFTTNIQTGIGFPVAVLLMTAGVTGGAKTGSVPTMSLFRRIVNITFDKKRLSGVTEVSFCEVSDSGPLWDKDSPAFQKLSTALVVNCVGRFPRS